MSTLPKLFCPGWMVLTLAFVAGSLQPKSLDAQARSEIATGSPVRLTVRGATLSDGLRRIEGLLVRLDADSVVVADGRHYRAAALDRLLRIEIRSNRGRDWGALRGLGWGASIGGIVGAVAGGVNPGDDPGGSGLFVAVVLGALGGGIGAAIGTAWPGERWVEVSAVRPGPSKDGSGP